jgi:hypothetical protein
MRALFTAEHRRGISLFHAKKFSEAAPHFEASYQALVRRPWLDRFRWLLLGSASAMSYREMALCNAAFCHSQSGDGTRARFTSSIPRTGKSAFSWPGTDSK